MRKIFLLVFSIFNYLNAFSQLANLDVSLPMVSYSSIDWRNGNAANSVFFDSVLAVGEVLVLTESDHGDGSTYNAHCMILKSLIDSHKMDVLIIESSDITVDSIVGLIKREGISSINKTYEFMRTGELRFWYQNGFWEYLCGKILSNEIKLEGFDIDGVSGKIVKSLLKEAMQSDSLTNLGKSKPQEFERFKIELNYFDGWGPNSRYDFEGYKLQELFINVIIRYYETKSDFKTVRTWKLILSYFFWMYRRSLVLQYNKYSNEYENDKQASAFHFVRDSLMADIFYEHVLKSKGKRIVALMSSYHSLKYPDEIEGIRDCCMDPNVKPMGQVLAEKYRVKSCNVAFISSSGERGMTVYSDTRKYQKIQKPVNGSIEKRLGEFSDQYLFINSKSIKTESFLMNVNFNRYLKSRWSKNYGGIFFIKKMSPMVIELPKGL